jgi:hypothetical protein
MGLLKKYVIVLIVDLASDIHERKAHILSLMTGFNESDQSCD